MIALKQNAPLFIRKAVKERQNVQVVIAINPKTKDIYFANKTTMYVNGKKRAAIRYKATGHKAVESEATDEA